VICDEAGQSYEPEHWMVLPFAKRWILAGDPKQLPALTRKNTKQLHISLLERWMHEHPQDCTMLTTQYRMHPDIMAFPSETFYNGQLLADPSTRSQTHDFGEEQTWMFIDTAGAEAHEKTVDHSIQNMLEARWIVSKLTQWKTDGIDLSNIGVITPYDAQKRLIKQLMSKNGFNEHDRECIEIQSVDGFQGREKKVILISFVRCNEDGELGFVDDPQRLNVALTRAQQHLICIGDSITLSHSKYLSELMAHSETSGNYRSWFEMEPQ
jgi:superfamily I DNA and/or RNA helicase